MLTWNDRAARAWKAKRLTSSVVANWACLHSQKQEVAKHRKLRKLLNSYDNTKLVRKAKRPTGAHARRRFALRLQRLMRKFITCSLGWRNSLVHRHFPGVPSPVIQQSSHTAAAGVGGGPMVSGRPMVTEDLYLIPTVQLILIASRRGHISLTTAPTSRPSW